MACAVGWGWMGRGGAASPWRLCPADRPAPLYLHALARCRRHRAHGGGSPGHGCGGVCRLHGASGRPAAGAGAGHCGRAARRGGRACAPTAAAVLEAPHARSGAHRSSFSLAPPSTNVQGTKLYWLTLEGLVAAEGARPGATPGAGASLLAAPLFHRCVAACSFEVVIGAYRMVGGRLSALPGRMGCGRASHPCTAAGAW